MYKSASKYWVHEEVSVNPFQGVINEEGQSSLETNQGGDVTNQKESSETNKGNDKPEGVFGWHSGVKLELQEAIKGMETPSVIVEKYLEAKKSLNEQEGAVYIPGEGASEEEIKAFNTALGVPEKFEDYPDPQVEVPEGLTLSFDSSKENALRAGIPANKYAAFMKLQAEGELKNYNAVMQKVAQARTESEKAVKEKYGDKFDEVKAKADLLIAVGGNSFKSLSLDKDLDKDPRFVEAMMAIASSITEDRFPGSSNETQKIGKKSHGFVFDKS